MIGRISNVQERADRKYSFIRGLSRRRTDTPHPARRSRGYAQDSASRFSLIVFTSRSDYSLSHSASRIPAPRQLYAIDFGAFLVELASLKFFCIRFNGSNKQRLFRYVLRCTRLTSADTRLLEDFFRLVALLEIRLRIRISTRIPGPAKRRMYVALGHTGMGRTHRLTYPSVIQH